MIGAVFEVASFTGLVRKVHVPPPPSVELYSGQIIV